MDCRSGKYLIEQRLMFDSHLMTLSQDGHQTELTSNEAQLLLLLTAGTVKKQTVIAEVWESKGVFVTEGSYHQLIRSLRLKLQAHDVPGNLIKTLPRLGLKFVGAIEHLPDDTPPVRAGPAEQETVEVQGVAEQPAMESEAATESTQNSLPHAPAEDGHRGATGYTGASFTRRKADEAGLLVAACQRDQDGLDGELAPAAPVDFAPHWVAPAASPNPHPSKRRPMQRVAVYTAVYITLGVWAAFLAWRTFFPERDTFQFRYQQTIGGVHYFSTGKMEQRRLLRPLGIAPAPGSYIYQIDLGERDWLAICPKSIYEAPELCKAYFFEEVKTR